MTTGVSSANRQIDARTKNSIQSLFPTLGRWKAGLALLSGPGIRNPNDSTVGNITSLKWSSSENQTAEPEGLVHWSWGSIGFDTSHSLPILMEGWRFRGDGEHSDPTSGPSLTDNVYKTI